MAMFLWAIESLIASALMMALVLIAREPVRRWFGSPLAYALWALPAIRLVLPPLPAFGGGMLAAPIGQVGGAVLVRGIAAPSAVAGSDRSAVALLVAVLVWVCGALAFLAFHLFGHFRFCRRIVSQATVEARDGGIRIVTSRAAPGPLAFGLWRRFVALPVEAGDSEERSLVLAHEIGHHRRGDLAANWVALIVLALHWPNPLAWRAYRAFRIDQELANDAQLLAGRSAAERHAYARAIVRATQCGAIGPACHLGAIADLKRRLKMLASPPPSRRRARSGMAVIGLACVTALGLTATVSQGAIPAATSTGQAARARTIVVRPDQTGHLLVLVDGRSMAPSPSLPAELGLPSDFSVDAFCKAGPQAPHSMVIKNDDDSTYTVSCTREARATVSAEKSAYEQALEGLLTMRRQVASQQTPSFPEVERKRALGAIDSSIGDVESQLATRDRYPDK